MYRCSKFYDHTEGLSASFRQPFADTHCRHVHGYALAFRFNFAAHTLDKNGWVFDFGKMKPVKEFLKTEFDHRTLIAANDPHMIAFKAFHDIDVINLNVVERVGCEAFAKMGFDFCYNMLVDLNEHKRVTLESVWCYEHPTNGAGFSRS